MRCVTKLRTCSRTWRCTIWAPDWPIMSSKVRLDRTSFEPLHCGAWGSGMEDSRGRLSQQVSHKIKSPTHLQRAPEQAWPSGEPEECEKNIPRKSDGFLSGQSRFQPGLRLPV